MNQFIRLAQAPAIAVVFASVWFSGCATPESGGRATVLSLPYGQFDQTFGSGWRPIFDRREYGKAAALIEDYLRSHHELTVGQQKFLHLHAAMLLALEGRNFRAIKHADQAVCHETAPELGQSWNDMVAATRAFLAHDRASLLAARERLAAAQYPQLKYIDRLCDTFGSSYADMYWWARLCPAVTFPQDASPPHRAAAEKLAKAFGFSATAVTTYPQPSCIWVELRDFAPESAAMGYVIIHSPDGTHITASNQYWLDAAVERFIKSSQESNGHREAPFGLSTSFNLAR